jgi:hypothetical protein
VTACQAAGQAPAGPPLPIVLTCWSVVHGAASLWVDGPLQQAGLGEELEARNLGGMVSGVMRRLMDPAPAPAQAGE